MAAIIGRKIGMIRVFDEDGRSVAVTAIQAGPCFVSQVKTLEVDGYEAVQLAFESKKEKNTSKGALGHFAKSGLKPMRVLREFQGLGDDGLKTGDEITVERFAEGDFVAVTGWSKGKGFQGVMKRHGFHGGPKSHGQSDRLRAPGSIGQSSYPSRVFKGLRMGGRMGNDRTTLKNRKIVRILKEKNMLMVDGPVPGAKSSLILIEG